MDNYAYNRQLAKRKAIARYAYLLYSPIFNLASFLLYSLQAITRGQRTLIKEGPSLMPELFEVIFAQI